jgi:SET domain-containing protein
MNSEDVVTRRSSISGQGLFATQSFTVGEWIAPYLGKIITSHSNLPDKSSASFILEIKPGLWLDGSDVQNPSRAANHSCEPNAELVLDETESFAKLRALSAIQVGDEITFDYGYSLSESLFNPCSCGKMSCPGKIIASPLRPALRRHLRFLRRSD